jgi:hypothetical protein
LCNLLNLVWLFSLFSWWKTSFARLAKSLHFFSLILTDPLWETCNEDDWYILLGIRRRMTENTLTCVKPYAHTGRLRDMHQKAKTI